MIEQAALDEVFSNPPLREVAFEIRFPRSLRVLRDVCLVQEELGSENIQVTRQEVLSPNMPPLASYVFMNAENGQTIKVAEDRFAIAWARYQTFEAFKTEIISRTYWFCELFRVKHLTRVGLRYINNIHISSSESIAQISRFIHPYINISELKNVQIHHFNSEILLRKEDSSLTVRSGFIQKTPVESVYVLDLDAFTVANANLENLPQLLDRLHHDIQVEFLTHITAEYKQWMRK